MPPKYHSRMLDSYSSEDKSDTEYKVELESSEASDSYSEEEKSNSKRIRRQSKKNKINTKRIKKRSGFQWHEEDEIIVLKQLYEFSGNNASYSKAFYDFVNKRLNNSQVSMNQMQKKIDRLKKEYLENECRRKDNALKFSKRHPWQVFVLSNRIWGPDKSNNNGGGMKKAKGFMEYLQEMEIDINSLMPSCLEYLKKEWEVQLLMYIQLLYKKRKFDAKVSELLLTKSLNSSPTQGFHSI